MDSVTDSVRRQEENEVIKDTVKEMFPNIPDTHIDSAVKATERKPDRPVRERFHSTVRRVARKK